MSTRARTRETARRATLAALRDGRLKQPEFRAQWQGSGAKRAIATALVRVRKQAGLKQTELAERAGWDKGFVSRLEAASGAIPDTVTLMRYATACDRVMGLVFGSLEEANALVLDAVTLAPRSGHPFEHLRGLALTVDEEAAG